MEVDKEITRYFRWFIKRRYHLHSLIAPSWDAHVSVVRGEKPEDDLKHLWKKHDGKVVEFKYSVEVERILEKDNRNTNDIVWAVRIDAPALMDVRKELHRPTNWGLHLTVGKENY
jgi:hypothetical protein